MSFLSLQQHWYSRQQLFSKHVPGEVLPWLFETSSLTARLIRMCPNRFHVEVISQQVSRPTLDEHRVLNMRHGRSGLVRQVRLYCGKTPVVYARTVIPVSTIQGAQRCYANLGNRPLGAMLFADRTMRRDEVMVSKLPLSNLQPGDALYAATGVKAESVKKANIWGRRSIFHVGGKPLLVSEYYLPELFKYSGFRL